MYDSQVFAADFVNNPRQAAGHINRWVSEQTNSMIDHLFAPGDLHPLTAIVLVNALYFDGKWKHPFPPEKTRSAPFYLEGGGETRVQMMTHEKLNLPYLRGDGFQAVALPYRFVEGMSKSWFSFYLFLPDEERTVGWLREQWTAENWMKWRKAFANTHFELQMPRFDMEYQCDLRNALIAVGMESAFDPQTADFGRMTTNQERMWIDKAFQRSLVELDEQGTRAISVSGFIQARSSRSRPPLKIVVDRPFLFAIVHEPTGIVLFLGIVREP